MTTPERETAGNIAESLRNYIGNPQRRQELAEEIYDAILTAKAEAIEACAKVAEKHAQSYGFYIATAIRALAFPAAVKEEQGS